MMGLLRNGLDSKIKVPGNHLVFQLRPDIVISVLLDASYAKTYRKLLNTPASHEH